MATPLESPSAQIPPTRVRLAPLPRPRPVHLSQPQIRTEPRLEVLWKRRTPAFLPTLVPHRHPIPLLLIPQPILMELQLHHRQLHIKRSQAPQKVPLRCLTPIVWSLARHRSPVRQATITARHRRETSLGMDLSTLPSNPRQESILTTSRQVPQPMGMTLLHQLHTWVLPPP